VATDAAGNVYNAGIFWGTAQFAGTTLVSQGEEDLYVTKYSPQGALLWIRQAGSANSNDVLDLAVDAAGNVVLTGRFWSGNTVPTASTITFGTTTLTGGSLLGDMFLAKYDTQGNLLWVQQTVSQGGYGSAGTDLALDTNGTIYVGGTYSTSVRFGTVAVTAPASRSYFLAKYTAQGQLTWVRPALGDGTSPLAYGRSFLQVAVTARNEVYLLSKSRAAVTLNTTTTLPSNTTPYGVYYLAKLDSQGALQWVRQDVLTAAEYCYDLAVSPNNNLVFACVYTGTTTHQNQLFTAQNGANPLLMSFSASGDFLWGQTMSPNTNQGSENIRQVTLDAQGNIYTVFLARQLVSYSPSGGLRWQRTSPQIVLDVAAAAPDQIVCTGLLDGSASFDAIRLTSAGSADAFLAKLAVAVPPSAPTDPDPLLLGTIPNIITPNGDGQNDSFRLLGLPAGSWQLRVFSRWGRLVYAVGNYQQDWQASGLADGQYFYQLQGPSQQKIQGWLEVLR
jgi:gliding motility-associated-like protein